MILISAPVSDAADPFTIEHHDAKVGVVARPEYADQGSPSQQQHKQHDQKNCPKATADDRAAVPEPATAEDQQEDQNEDDQVHGLSLAEISTETAR